jgi:hypothetical protein
MIVDKVDIAGIPIFEPEHNRPIRPDGDGEKTSQLSFECMKSKAWAVEIVNPVRGIEQREDIPNPFDHVRRQKSGVVILIEAFQTLVPKSSQS